jgi:hypothetical protein
MIATVFAFFSMFVIPSTTTPESLAMTAIGFQLAVEIARHFNTAVRWTATVEIEMLNIKRLLQTRTDDIGGWESAQDYRTSTVQRGGNALLQATKTCSLGPKLCFNYW